MSIRQILCPFAGMPRDDMLDIAAAIARRHEAELECLYFCRPSDWSDRFFGENFAPGWTEDFAETLSTEVRVSADRARAWFERWHERDGIRCRQSQDPVQTAPIRWTECLLPYGEALGTAGRTADLIVVAKAERGRPSVADRIFEAALLTTGRPVLLVPGRNVMNHCGAAVIAWNNSPQAARAVAGALPLLKGCWKIKLLAVQEDGVAPPLQPLQAYLALHGLRADVEVRKADDLTIGETLIMAADEAHADLLIMGAYSHDRTRERIFGGTTREVMRDARTLVLWSS
jgi:nucleotide-binding universal stress UspA family protein